jgi:hypothetical protein
VSGITQKGAIEVATSRVRLRIKHTLIAGLAAVSVALALSVFPGNGRSAAQAGGTQKSLNVAVIPSFAPPDYPGTFGVPALPVKAPQLSAYHFSQLATGSVTAAALKKYDTVILYGIRWRDIPTSGQAAINAFAATHKVLIWDSDGTGSQNYSSFIHPFVETASGENYSGKPNNSVVTFPNGTDFLASDNPSSPYYLDPDQLETNRDEINDMNAMTTGTKSWVPALIAANFKIPNGGWPLAWSYGVIGNHTGLTVYSGLDADAFSQNLSPFNNAIKELALQLQATFRQTPDPSCAPGCRLPSSGGTTTHAACSFAKPIPKKWVHGRVAVWLQTSVAAGITGRVVTHSGRIVGSGKERAGGLIRLLVKTKRLHTNRASKLRALVLVKGQRACTKPFKLKVDNTRTRILSLTTSRSGGEHLAAFRVSELSTMSVVGPGVPKHRAVLIAGHRWYHVRLPARVRRARLVLRDRAGNKTVRTLAW